MSACIYHRGSHTPLCPPPRASTLLRTAPETKNKPNLENIGEPSPRGLRVVLQDEQRRRRDPAADRVELASPPERQSPTPGAVVVPAAAAVVGAGRPAGRPAHRLERRRRGAGGVHRPREVHRRWRRVHGLVQGERDLPSERRTAGKAWRGVTWRASGREEVLGDVMRATLTSVGVTGSGGERVEVGNVGTRGLRGGGTIRQSD